MEGIIILIVTLLAFLAIIIWVVVKVVQGPKLPSGQKFEAVFAGNTAVLIVDNGIPALKDKNTNEVSGWLLNDGKIVASELAKKCAIAITAVETAFRQKGVEKADVNMVVFHYQTDEQFETGNASWWKDWAKNVAAYSVSLSGIFGIKKIPMAIIRARYLKDTHERGQPNIHELVHILNKAATGDYSHNHSDPLLWLGPGGVDSVEGIAVAQWADLVEAFEDENK